MFVIAFVVFIDVSTFAFSIIVIPFYHKLPTQIVDKLLFMKCY